MRRFKTGRFSTSSLPMDRGSSSATLAVRDARWSEAVAVGSLAFVEKIKGELGVKALHREVEQLDGSYALREPGEAYSGHFHIENEALNVENTLPWERIGEVPAT